MSPRTRMATERNEARSTGFLTNFHTRRQNAATNRTCRNRVVSIVILVDNQTTNAGTCPAPDKRDGTWSEDIHSPNRDVGV